MKNYSVIVKEIRATKNPEVMNLMLTSKNDHVAETEFDVFMAGASFATPKKDLVGFRTISTAQIEAKGIVEGSDLGECLGIPCRLVITESLTPRTWDGGQQSPKINPSTGVTITHNGQPIYYNVDLVIGEAVESSSHSTLKADKLEVPSFQANAKNIAAELGA